MLLIPALLIVIHAARMHQARAKQLDARAVSQHFDKVGPTLLTFVLSLSLLVNLLLAVAHHVWEERTFYQPDDDGAATATAGGIPNLFWACASVAAFGGAAAVTLPALSLPVPTGISAGSSLGQGLLQGEAKAASVGPLRPKLLYANERTFIHWSHICTLIASTAMAITATAPKAGFQAGPRSVIALYAGGMLTCTSLALLGYAHRTYFWRAHQIMRHSDQRCDDGLGPQMLAYSLLVAIAGGMIALLVPSAQAQIEAASHTM